MSGGKTVQFGKIPSKVMQSGVLKTLIKDPAALVVYMAIASRVGGNTWSSFPSAEQIAKDIGVSERTVQRAIPRLVDAGLITVKSGGGRGHSNAYTLTTDLDKLRHPCVSPFTGGETTTNPDLKGDRSERKLRQIPPETTTPPRWRTNRRTE